MNGELLTNDRIIAILHDHCFEVWNGYAVCQYTRYGIPGESFTPLAELNTVHALRDWLGY
jgi:hypothetical protein